MLLLRKRMNLRRMSAHDVISVEAVVFDAVDVSGEQSIDEIAFEAEHFSVYTVTFTNSSGKEYHKLCSF